MARQSKQVEEGKIWAFLGVFLGVIGFVIVYFGNKKNNYAMFYAKQGLVLTIAYIIVSVIAFVPFIGWIIDWLGKVVLLILWIIGIIYSFSGELKDIPVVGEFAKKIKI